MDNITRVSIVRHGETEWNLEDKMQGILDSPLTPKGIALAKELGEKLDGMKFSSIYTSDLGRAWDTAKYINEKLKLEIVPDKRLRERDMGIFATHDWAYVKEHYPDDFKKAVSDDMEYRIPKGQSKQDYIQQIQDFMTFVTEKHPGENILVVTHRGWVDFFMRLVLGISVNARRCFKVGNTSLNVFSFEKGRWMLERFGDL